MKRIERFVRKLRVPFCAKPFVIWFLERSGSSHLCSLLNSHPDIICRHEDFHEAVIDCPVNDGDQQLAQSDEPVANTQLGRRIVDFNEVRHASPSAKQVRQHLYDLYSSGEQACGFKFKYPVQFELFPEVLDELIVLKPGIKVVALFRRNVLKQAISRQNMQRIVRESNGSQVHLHEALDPDLKKRIVTAPLEIDVQEALNYSTHLKADQEALRTVISEFEQQTGITILTIQYEDLLMRKQQTMESVLRYLGLSVDHPLYSNFEKSTPNRLSDGVRNFDELAMAVAGTDLEIYLDDE